VCRVADEAAKPDRGMRGFPGSAVTKYMYMYMSMSMSADDMGTGPTPVRPA
jgi:hypothetical protein